MNHIRTPSNGHSKPLNKNQTKWSSTVNLHSKAPPLAQVPCLYSIHETLIAIESFHFLKTIKKGGVISLLVGEQKLEARFEGSVGKNLSLELKFQDYEPPHKLETKVFYLGNSGRALFLGSNIHIFVKNKAFYAERLIIFDKGEIKGFVNMRFQFKNPKISPPRLFGKQTAFSKQMKKFFINSEKAFDNSNFGSKQSNAKNEGPRISIENFTETQKGGSLQNLTEPNGPGRLSGLSSRAENSLALRRQPSIAEKEMPEKTNLRASGSQKYSFKAQTGSNGQISIINKNKGSEIKQEILIGLGKAHKNAQIANLDNLANLSNEIKAVNFLKSQWKEIKDCEKSHKRKLLNIKLLKQIEEKFLAKQLKKSSKKNSEAEILQNQLKKISEAFYKNKFSEVKEHKSKSFDKKIEGLFFDKLKEAEPDFLISRIKEISNEIKDLEFEQKELLGIKSRLTKKMEIIFENKEKRTRKKIS